MIIYTANNGMKLFETRSDAPFSDFTGGRAEFVIDERKETNAGLIRDIKRLAPFFIPVLGDGGELVGVIDDAEARAAFEATKEPAPPTPEERITVLEEALDMILSEVTE